MSDDLDRLIERARAAELLRSLSADPLDMGPPIAPDAQNVLPNSGPAAQPFGRGYTYEDRLRTGPYGSAQPVSVVGGELNFPQIAPEPAPSRGVGAALWDNIVGSDDGVDSWGEQLGRGINDMGSAALAGTARGVAGLVGLPGTGVDLVGSGITRTGQALGVVDDDYVSPNFPLGGAALIEGLSGLTGGASDYRGENRASRVVGTAAEFVPGALAFGGGTTANAIRYGVAPGVASELAGQATEGTAAEPYARVAGALLAPLALNAGERVMRRVISPHGGADPGRLDLAQVLDDAGVPVSAGQRVGSDSLRRQEGLTSAGQRLNETQREALTAAALRTAGSDATRATPEVLAATSRRIGDVFDDVVRGVDVAPTPGLVSQLDDALVSFVDAMPSGGSGPAVIVEMQRRVADAAASGATIPAGVLTGWRSRLSRLTTSADDALRTASRTAMNGLDDALEATLISAGRTEDVARLATAREQYRNFLAIQRAATGAGEGAARGILSPSALRGAVVNQGRAAYAQGHRGGLGELSRAAEGVIRPLPTSGTAENLLAAMNGPSMGFAGAGGALGALLGGPGGAAVGSVGGLAAPAAIRAARMSGPGQAYLANQIAGPGSSLSALQASSPVAAALAEFYRGQ